MDQDGLHTYQCHYCGESNGVFVDLTAGLKQVFVEDCAVCCRPNVLTVIIDTSLDSVSIDAEFEG